MPVTSTPRRNHSLATVVAALVVGVLVGVGVMFLPGASKEGARDGAATTRPAPPPPFEEVTFRQRQRTSRALPGVEGRAVLAIGDVTGGKVKVSVSVEGQALVEETAVKEGDVVNVPIGGRKLSLTVKEMRNALVGEDEVVFVLKEAGAPAALTEEEKIERLIAAVSGLEGAVFIRNGGEHSAADAAQHMRRKYERGKGRITTAREFITHAASKSSLSGEAYRIRFADGKEVTAEAFFKKELEKIEGAGAATRPIDGVGAGSRGTGDAR